MSQRQHLNVEIVLTCLLASGIIAAVPVPPGDPEAGQDAVVLEESLEIEILSDSAARVRYLNRTKVLTAAGVERFNVASVYYNPSSTIRELRGSITSPEGKRLEVKKQQIFDGAAFASYELYSDSRHRSLTFLGAVPGATLEYRYEMDLRNLFFLPDSFTLQEPIPVRLKTFTVRVPSTVGLRYAVRGSPEYTREEVNGIVAHRWLVRDVPALRREFKMPPEGDVCPRVQIYLKQIMWDSHPIDASAWNGIARWYADLARDRMVPSPEVGQKARELTVGVNDPREKIRRLYEFVQGSVNYVAIELGIGGFQPHDNLSVLQHRYGDCKDKATLLIALLRGVGLQGYPVLILTRDEGLTDQDFPSAMFNHMIAAVPESDGYLFLDPTSSNTPFGYLPWSDQGANVLVVKEDGTGDLVQTPLLSPDRNRTRWSLTASVGPTGDLESSCLIEAWGQRRTEFADFLAQSKPTEREDAFARFMATVCPGAILQGHEVSVPSTPADPLRIALRFTIPHFLVHAGNIEVVSLQLVRFPELAKIAASPARQFPVFFDYLFSESFDLRLLLPPARTPKSLPTGQTIEGAGLKASTSYEAAEAEGRKVVVVRRSLSCSRREIPAAEYPELRQFLAALAEEESRAVTLQAGS